MLSKLLPLLLLVSCVSSAMAQEVADPIVLTESFLEYHPDIKFRMLGMDAVDAGNAEQAIKNFERAAKFADKPAQAMIAELYWKGEGVAQNRALAYAWMDLAAEREYQTFATVREKYWSELSQEDRKQAIEEGRELYAAYGDDVAKPRIAKKIRAGIRKVTGSRVGFVGSLDIMIPGPAGWVHVSGDKYYSDDYWRTRDYFAWQDRMWSGSPKGTVDVGPVEATMSTESVAQ